MNYVSFPVTSIKGDCVMLHQTTNTDDINCDNTAIIKYIPDNKSDEYDVNGMIDVGLCVNVPVKPTVRLNSNNGNSRARKVDNVIILDYKQRNDTIRSSYSTTNSVMTLLDHPTRLQTT